jgi:3-methylcrotonyl-CoA carboxylase alpha subunit
MNTRLQVEHPVTEEITGQDLVEWQLLVASGEKLPKKQDELSITGHAIEARLYAEDPAKDFLPSVGRLEHFELGEEGRIETGVEEGDAISPFYDPMIAKLVTHGEDREAARNGLLETLYSVKVWPVKSNAAFLANCLKDPAFVSADLDTGLIARRGEQLSSIQVSPEEKAAGAILVLERMLTNKMLAPLRTATGGPSWVAEEGSTFNPLLGFRLNQTANREIRLGIDGQVEAIDLDSTGPQRAWTWDYVDRGAWAGREDGLLHLFTVEPRTGASITGHGVADGVIVAPMPGRVTAVEVAAGETVVKGQRLVTLEAMKMEQALVAPFDGVVAEVNAEAGTQVVEGAVLVKVEPADASSRT